MEFIMRISTVGDKWCGCYQFLWSCSYVDDDDIQLQHIDLACFLPTYSIPTARASRQGYRRPHTDQSSTPSNHDPHSLNGQATEDPRPSNESEIPHPTNIPQSPNRDNPGDPTSDQTPVPIQTNPWETPIRLTMLDPLKPDREILPAYNPPKESLKDMSLFVSLLCCVRKVSEMDLDLWSSELGLDRFLIHPSLVLTFLSLCLSISQGARSKAADRYQTSRYGRVIPDDNIPQEIIEFLSTYIALLQIRQSAEYIESLFEFHLISSLDLSLISTFESVETQSVPFSLESIHSLMHSPPSKESSRYVWRFRLKFIIDTKAEIYFSLSLSLQNGMG